jgi:hypothetical protein
MSLQISVGGGGLGVGGGGEVMAGTWWKVRDYIVVHTVTDTDIQIHPVDSSVVTCETLADSGIVHTAKRR